MQPYIFPYLGYYQLVHSCDRFVLYDDVTFIKQGYINRNSILSNGRALRFTLPVPGASSNRRIGDLRFSEQTGKVTKSIQQAYSKAPFFDDVYPIVERVVEHMDRGIAALCGKGISEVFEYIGLHKEILRSSELDYDRGASAEHKIIQICHALGSRSYINSIGGKKLYDKASFTAQGCELSFIQMKAVEYNQGMSDFVPNLSIIDVLMRCSKDEIGELLNSYVLV